MDYSQIEKFAESVAEAAIREDDEEEADEAQAGRYRMLVDGIEIKPGTLLFAVPREDCVQNAYQYGLTKHWHIRDERCDADYQGIWALAHLESCNCGNCGPCLELIDIYLKEVLRWYVTLGQRYNTYLKEDASKDHLKHVSGIMRTAFLMCMHHYNKLHIANPKETTEVAILNAVRHLILDMTDGNWTSFLLFNTNHVRHDVCHTAVINMARYAFMYCSTNYMMQAVV